MNSSVKEMQFDTKWFLVFLVSALIFAGCNEKNPTGDNGDPEVFSMEVDSTGGTFLADGGKVQLAFPEGSVDTAVTITVQRVEGETGEDVIPGNLYDLGPSGNQFAKPVELQMVYDPGDMSEDSLVIVKFYENGNRQIFFTEVDTANKILKTSIRSFSRYGPRYYSTGTCTNCVFDQNLTAQYNSNRTIDLEWQPRNSTLTIELQRAVVKGRFVAYDSDFQRIALLPGNTRTYTDSGLGNEGALYFYRLRRINPPNLFPYSKEVMVTVFGQVTPCADFTIATANGSAPADVNSELDITINRINGFSQPIGLQLGSKDPTLTLEEIFSGYRLVPNPTQGDAKLNYTLSPVWSPGRTFNFTVIGSTSNGSANCTGNASITVDAAPPVAEPEVFTLAGNGTAGFSDGQGSTARFDTPYGLDYNTDTQTIYVADFNNHAIRAISGDGAVTTIAGTGSPGSQNGNTATFNNPLDVAVDASNNQLYVSDYNNHQIRRIDLSNGSVITYAGTGTTGNDDGPAGSASFHFPGGLLIHEGLLYIVDRANHAIRSLTLEVNPANAIVDTYAGSGIIGDQDGANEQARFDAPFDLAYDPVTDRLLVTEFGNDKIRAVGPNTTTSPSGFITPGNTPLDQPAGIAVDSQGTVFVAEGLNHILRTFIPLGQGVYSQEIMAGDFKSGGFVDAAAPDARFNFPSGLVLGSVIDNSSVKQALIILDTNNHAIRFIPLE